MVHAKEDENSVLCKSGLYQDLKKAGKIYGSMSEAHSACLSGKGKTA